MKLPGKEIAASLQEQLEKDVKALQKHHVTPHLVTVLVGNSPDQLSFVKIKNRLAQKLGIKFTFIQLKKCPSFEEFAGILKKHSADPSVNGLIIQQPLPCELQTNSIYNFIPLAKEIEGHKPKSPFHWPLGLAVLTAIKYIYNGQKVSKDLIVTLEDKSVIKKALKHKHIIIAGRGITGGAPIGKTLNEFGLNYMSMNSKMENPDEYYKNADIIITAVGKKVIKPEALKPGVVLLNVGLRREKGNLKGDYDEHEVDDIASFYSQTPGGIGPIDVLYLFKNLIDATKLQNKL